jgi:DNA repair protein SbcD/Mre11
MTVRILHTADLQIGRIPSRLPDRVEAGPTHVWQRIVEYAIDQRLDAVTLGGDIVDADNRYYEAYGPLEQGIRRLSEHGIGVIAVSGNHDVETFPSLSKSLEDEGFILLGKGGTWERHTLEKDGRPALYIDGWSFPTERVHQDPVTSYDLPPPKDAPAVGLLHGDLDQPQSIYAPLNRQRLHNTAVSAWLLGHIHKPQWIDSGTGAKILYPGSPQGLDPGEPGLHGAWVLTFTHEGLQEHRFVPLASAIYEKKDIDLEGATDANQVRSRIVEGMRSHLQELLRKELGPLQHVVFRLRLTGRTVLHGQPLARALQGIQESGRGLTIEQGGITAHIDKTYQETTPELDLNEIARSTGPPATLARTLLELEDPTTKDPLNHPLVRQVRATLDDLRSTVHYNPLQDDPWADEALEPLALTRRQGLLLLQTLLDQKAPKAVEA